MDPPILTDPIPCISQPYFLDSYLGVWGKDLLEGEGALDPVQSALLFLTFFVLVLVGTLAAQVVLWDGLVCIGVRRAGKDSP